MYPSKFIRVTPFNCFSLSLLHSPPESDRYDLALGSLIIIIIRQWAIEISVATGGGTSSCGLWFESAVSVLVGRQLSDVSRSFVRICVVVECGVVACGITDCRHRIHRGVGASTLRISARTTDYLSRAQINSHSGHKTAGRMARKVSHYQKSSSNRYKNREWGS